MDKPLYVPKEKIDETLAVAVTQGKKNLEPFKTFAKENNLPFSILEDSQITDNEAEIHKLEADLWFCMEGEVTFVVGGEMVEPWSKINADGTTNDNEIKSKQIKDGEVHVLKPGDWLWIPAGVPHQHNTESTARLVIIKIPKK
jgi:mannose-6-phosphate isomerase-like protein (cupin superfamily)